MADQMEGRRREVARKVLSPFSDEFKQQVGPGMVVLLEQQGLTMEDVDEMTGGKENADMRNAARMALERRISENYPSWDDVKVNDYIKEGTANDFPAQGPERGMPEGQFPPAETLQSSGESDYSMPMQEGEKFPPAEQLESVGMPEPEEPKRSPEPAAAKPATGGDEKSKTAPYKQRMERLREAFGLDPKY
tara:strand:- start:352 stop:924 length:573 start_codon:yes stop_codon:yes gene_type:complete